MHCHSYARPLSRVWQNYLSVTPAAHIPPVFTHSSGTRAACLVAPACAPFGTSFCQCLIDPRLLSFMSGPRLHTSLGHPRRFFLQLLTTIMKLVLTQYAHTLPLDRHAARSPLSPPSRGRTRGKKCLQKKARHTILIVSSGDPRTRSRLPSPRAQAGHKGASTPIATQAASADQKSAGVSSYAPQPFRLQSLHKAVTQHCKRTREK